MTGSMVERFGLFVIIVLGEVVVGVVHGLSEAEHDVRTVATGVLCLGIGFGFWWTYFDFVGHRLPRASPGALSAWMFTHLPTTMAIAAAGAGMVSLVEHADDSRAPTASSWLIAAAVAGLLVSPLTAMRSLGDHERLAHVYRPLTPALLAAAGASLVLGALHRRRGCLRSGSWRCPARRGASHFCACFRVHDLISGTLPDKPHSGHPAYR